MIWISRRSLHSLSEPGILRENFLPSPTSECTLGKPFNSETLRNLKLFSKNISTFATLRESNRTKEPWQKTFLQKRLGTAKGTIFSLFLLLVSSEDIYFNFIMEVSHIWHFNQNHQKSKHEGKKLQFLHFPVFRSNVGKDFCCFEIWNVVFRFQVCQIANANQIKPNSPATKLNSRRRSHQGILNKMAKIFVKYHFALFPKKHFRKF